jgi:hypothetical protein
VLWWRQGRVSPPRCLTCASTDIEYFTRHEESPALETIVHPGCGGTISSEGYSHIMIVGEIGDEYLPEGVKIPRDRVAAGAR